jgi:hypothetical protein
MLQERHIRAATDDAHRQVPRGWLAPALRVLHSSSPHTSSGACGEHGRIREPDGLDSCGAARARRSPLIEASGDWSPFSPGLTEGNTRRSPTPSHNTACRQGPVRRHRIWLLLEALTRDGRGPHLPGKQAKLLRQFPWRRGVAQIKRGSIPCAPCCLCLCMAQY